MRIIYNKFLLSKKEFDRQSDEYDKAKYKCKCGHRVIIPEWESKQLCSCCKKYVFKNKKEEDLYRIKERLK